MIPVDAKIWEERDVRRDGVSVEETLSELSGSGAAQTDCKSSTASRRNPYERRFQGIFTRTCADRGRREFDRQSTSDVAGAGHRRRWHIAEPFREWPRGQNKSPRPFRSKRFSRELQRPSGDRREQEHSGAPAASNANS